MQMMAKMAWNAEGARHAHVEFHLPVPSVTPAASRAPTLRASGGSRDVAMLASLVKVLKYSHAPRPPLGRKRLREVHRGSHAGPTRPQAQHGATDDKHGDILGSCLDDNADERHKRGPEDGRSATEPIRENAGHR